MLKDENQEQLAMEIIAAEIFQNEQVAKAVKTCQNIPAILDSCPDQIGTKRLKNSVKKLCRDVNIFASQLQKSPQKRDTLHLKIMLAAGEIADKLRELNHSLKYTIDTISQ